MNLKFFVFFTLVTFWTQNLVSQSLKNDDCQSALLLTRDTLLTDTLRLSTLSTALNCDYRTPQFTRAKWYKYVGDGKLISLKLDNKFQYSNQLVVYEGRCDSLKCRNYRDYQTTKFITQKDVVYYFVVQKPEIQSLNDAPFTIEFSAVSLKDHATCDQAPILDCGDALSFDFAKDLVPSNLATCQTYESVGYFRITGDGNKRIFNFSGGDLSGYYLLFNETDDCLNSNCTGIRYLAESIPYTTEMGKSYLIMVVKYLDNANNNINMQVSCEPDFDTAKCTNAINILCNKTYVAHPKQNSLPEIGGLGFVTSWYKIEGDNSKIVLNFTNETDQNAVFINVYSTKNGCDSLNLLMQKQAIHLLKNIVINANAGFEYYVQIFHQSMKDVTFSTTCEPTNDTNIDCTSAIDLRCNTSVPMYRNFLNQSQSCTSKNQGGHWYKIAGSDKVYEFDFSLENDQSVRLSIFKGSCETLSCVLDQSLYRNQLLNSKVTLKVPKGETYYIRFMSNDDFISKVLTVQCREASTVFNPVCQDATTISCGDKVSPSSRIYGIDLGDPCEEYIGIWYKVIGENAIVHIPTFSYNNTKYSVYKGDCDQLTCIKSNINDLDGLRFFAAMDSVYFVKIYLAYKDNFFPDQNIGCKVSANNLHCQDATKIDCEQQSLPLDFSQAGIDLSYHLDCLPNVPGMWYYLEGNGKIFNFTSVGERDLLMSSFTGTCDSLICGTAANKKLKIESVQGQRYYIYLASLNANLELVNITCTDPVSNDSFDAATEIYCDTDFIADFSAGSYDTTRFSNPRTSLWYKIQGNNKPIVITKLDTLPLYYQYELYVQGLDSNLIKFPQDFLSFYDANSLSQFEFFGKQDETYFIKFVTDDNVKHIFRPSCREASIADICETAIPITCGKNYVFDSKDHTTDYFNGIHIENGMWFKFEGNDQYIDIVEENPIVTVALYVAETDCSNLKRLNELYAESGKTYYINIGNIGLNPTINNIQFVMNCRDAKANASQCSEAKVIQCGDNFITNNFKVQESQFSDCSTGSYNYGDWFTFIGDGSTWNFFKKQFGDQTHSPLVYVGTGTCDNLECIQGFDATIYQSLGEARNGFSFSTAIGVRYYLKFAPKNGEIFEYEYGVTCIDETQNFSCQTAQKIMCGDMISGTLLNAPLDTFNVCNNLKPGLYYEINGDGHDFGMILNNRINRGLNVQILENDCVNGRCLYEGQVFNDGNAIAFNTINNRKYFIKMSSDDTEAVFSFRTMCLTGNTNVDCNNTEFLTCDDTLNVTCYTPLGFEGTTPCQWNQNSSFWYLLPKSDSLFHLEVLDKSALYYNVELVKGNCNDIRCLASFSERNQNISFKVNRNDNNYLAIHAPINVINSLNLQLKCVLPPINDNCSGATEIHCGDNISGSTSLSNYNPVCFWMGKNVWYKFQGNDKKISFKFSKLQETAKVWIVEDKGCDDIECATSYYLNQSGTIDFVAETGKNYFLIIQHQNYSGGSFTLEMVCTDAVVNDLCNGAIELTEETFVDLSNSTGHYYTNLAGCQQQTENGVWYYTKGNDSVHVISTPLENSGFLYYQLFSGTCDQLTCIESGQVYNLNPIKFQAKAGINYYLYLFTNSNWQNGPYQLIYNSVPSPINDICVGALPINCSDSIHLDFANFTKDRISHCYSDYMSAWYTVKFTDNEQIDFVCNYPKNSFIVEIFENCESPCIMLNYINRDVENTISLIGQAEKSYYFKISPSQQDTIDMDFQIVCSNLVHNNISPKSAAWTECKSYNIKNSDLPIKLRRDCIESHKQLWYKFVGDGSLFKLEADFNLGISYALTDTACQTLQNFYFNNNYFVTEVGKEYYLVVSIFNAQFNNDFSFEIQYKCIDHTVDAANAFDRIKIMPNPFGQKTMVEFESSKNETSLMKIINTDGKIVYNKEIEVSQGMNRLEISNTEIRVPGVYKLIIQSTGNIRSATLIKVD